MDESELEEMYKQIVKTLQNEINDINYDIIKYSAEDTYVYRLLIHDCDLDDKYIDRLGNNEYGKVIWKKLRASSTKEELIKNLKDQINNDERLNNTGYIELITKIASELGSQSISVVVDVKRSVESESKYEIYTNNGTKYQKICFEKYLELLDKSGAGEIIINSIDRDGLMNGYDLELMKITRQLINCQLTALGGAGSIQDLIDLYNELGLVGASAGSLFIYKGPYKAVLISYPDFLLKQQITNKFYKIRPE
jgi:hypothetical protein